MDVNSNKRELLLTILRVANGIVLKDIIDCYENIGMHVDAQLPLFCYVFGVACRIRCEFSDNRR